MLLWRLLIPLTNLPAGVMTEKEAMTRIDEIVADAQRQAKEQHGLSRYQVGHSAGQIYEVTRNLFFKDPINDYAAKAEAEIHALQART